MAHPLTVDTIGSYHGVLVKIKEINGGAYILETSHGSEIKVGFAWFAPHWRALTSDEQAQYDKWLQEVAEPAIGTSSDYPVSWQPIATAPKDGTVVDIWQRHADGSGSRIVNVKWLTAAQADPERCGPGGCWEHLGVDGWRTYQYYKDGCGCLTEEYITHWMPLPTAPVKQEWVREGSRWELQTKR